MDVLGHVTTCLLSRITTIVVTNNEETGKYAIPPEKSLWSKGFSGSVFEFLKVLNIFKKITNLISTTSMQISCISGTAKKRNVPKFENTGGPIRIALLIRRSAIFSFFV
jgi:hypothetical protein